MFSMVRGNLMRQLYLHSATSKGSWMCAGDRDQDMVQLDRRLVYVDYDWLCRLCTAHVMVAHAAAGPLLLYVVAEG